MDLFKRIKIPYRTILVAFIFFVIGTFFLFWGAYDLMHNTLGEASEKLAIGAILFIPGSYHSVLAFQALRGAAGWDYEHLTIFENDQFF